VTRQVQLSPGAMAVASAIGSLRQAVNRTAGMVNLKAGPQDPMTTELVGIYGELGFAQWANVMPDLSIHLRAGSPDCTFHGRAVDVKATRKKAGPVWYTDWRPDKAMALYVFVMVDYATVDICGWVPEAVVRQRPGRAEWRAMDLRDPALLWQVPWPEEGCLE
jgi:hypothetical protein